MSMAEYARRVGVSRAAISHWKREGRLVLQGSQVDVEATDARLKRYRRDGLPPIQESREPVKRGRPVKQTTEQLNAANTGPVQMTCGEVKRRLAELDWTQDFKWHASSQEERARLAAECIGWEAVRSPLADDAHWGGFQLRIPEYIGKHGLTFDAVPAGHGFELDVWDVLTACRAELEAADEDDWPVTIRLGLLPLLAHPFAEYDKQR